MKIENLVRKNILKLKPYTSARESHLDGILLDANENSLGSVIEYEYIELNRYPDPNQNLLRESLSKFISIPKENLIFGVGSDEIIDLYVKIFCEPGIDEAITCEPTYGMYKVCCDINNVLVKNVPLNQNYDLDYDAILNSVNSKTKIIFLCSPNNPSGNLLSKEKIVELAKNVNSIVLVDEAYIDFSNNEGLIKEATKIPNLVVTRTFSKAWGLAGLRCGYTVANEKIIQLLFKVKMPYNINKLTSQLIVEALNQNEKYYFFVNQILKEKQRVEQELKKNSLIINVLPSDANFISFKVSNPKDLFTYLEKKGIVIRDRSNQYNFDGYLRVSIGTKEENDKFLNQLSLYKESNER